MNRMASQPYYALWWRGKRGHPAEKLVIRAPRAAREVLQQLGLYIFAEEYHLPDSKQDWWASGDLGQ